MQTRDIVSITFENSPSLRVFRWGYVNKDKLLYCLHLSFVPDIWLAGFENVGIYCLSSAIWLVFIVWVAPVSVNALYQWVVLRVRLQMSRCHVRILIQYCQAEVTVWEMNDWMNQWPLFTLGSVIAQVLVGPSEQLKQITKITKPSGIGSREILARRVATSWWN